MRERLRNAGNDESKTEVMQSLLRRMPALANESDAIVFSIAMAAKYEEYAADQVCLVP